MYTIKTSERNNDKATEYETKSLLYLLTKIKGHRSIDLFIIDCFNDVTGIAEGYKDSWDIQSKKCCFAYPTENRDCIVYIVRQLCKRFVIRTLYFVFASSKKWIC